MQGWIKLHRKLVDWEWYTDTVVKSLFIHLLIKANHSDRKWMGTVIKEGSFVTSMPSLAAETGLSLQQVRTALKKLEKTGEINRQITNRNTLIIVLNYAKYQDLDDDDYCEIQQADNRQITDKQQSSNSQITTTNNDNNDKNKKNVENIKKNEIFVDTNVSTHISQKENPPASKNSPLHYSAIVDQYNAICKDLPSVRLLTDARKQQIKVCSNLLKKAGMDFKSYFEKVQKSDFLTGKSKDWRADFDWIFKSGNCTKIIEGIYDNENRSPVSQWCKY